MRRNHADASRADGSQRWLGFLLCAASAAGVCAAVVAVLGLGERGAA